ncbi:MAG: dUTP diphosphatase [Melioribacteraceae bacterium]|nr:dUTP diphosphatase [Melioribacteraceae bacterium]
MEKVSIKILRIDNKFNDVLLPEYATEGSSGLDLRAAVESELIIPSGKVSLVPTNLKVEIPFGYEIQIRPRSGLAAKNGIGVLNSPGTIDSDYRGEIKVILFNFGEEDFIIKRGDRIAQMVISKVYKAELIESENLEISNRGSGGFGHTGLK